MRFLAVAAAVAAIGLGTLVAQEPTQTFEVASVKVNNSGDTEGAIGPRPNGYAARNVTLRLLIIRAYELRPFQVVGGPRWVDSDRFDVDARLPMNTPSSQTMVMLQALLADRFRLTVHREQREQPIYALVVDREGRVGSQLTPTSANCTEPVPAADMPCRMSGSMTPTRGSLRGIGQPLAALATQLSGSLDRTVVDRTRLAGLFDFDLQWSRGLSASGSSSADPAGEPPAIFTAVREQLGLRLEPSRGPVEFLVIDAVEHPTEN